MIHLLFLYLASNTHTCSEARVNALRASSFLYNSRTVASRSLGSRSLSSPVASSCEFSPMPRKYILEDFSDFTEDSKEVASRRWPFPV